MSTSILGAGAVGRIFLVAAFALLVPSAAIHAHGKSRGSPRYCSATAHVQEKACMHETRDDHLTARASCLNIGDEDERRECIDEAAAELRDGIDECDEIADAREDLCGLLGEQRYEPDFDPSHFDDPRNPTLRNPYFPLAVGDHWTYVEDEEQIDIDVLDKTKRIDGVTCIVVRDLVSEDGVPVEDTDDWFATHENGDIYYCGESTKDYETFPGDDPEEAELTSIDGSFKAGVDGAKAGILFPRDPRPGRTDRQEWAPGDAEDAATVVTKTYRYGVRPDLDEFVPAALANLLCSAGDCVVTREFTPIEPDGFEYKYYARGIGRFLEVNPEKGTTGQLIDCNVDPRCASLPEP